MATRSSNSLADIRAIKACLEELESHAAANGVALAANLIGAASRAIADELVERSAGRPACGSSVAFEQRRGK